MKKFKYLTVVLLVLFSFMACEEWVEPKAKDLFEPRSEEYYANLRAYKQTPHEVAFGWFSGWTGTGASLKMSLAGLPDSLDFVSIWDNWNNLTPAQIADRDYTRRVKGTRFLLCFIIANVGDKLTPPEVGEGLSGEAYRNAVNDYWGYDAEDPAKVEASIRRYANEVYKTVVDLGYDGFDIDFEPDIPPFEVYNGNLTSAHSPNMLIFADELGKYMGPMSGSDKLLVLDGVTHKMPHGSAKYFDYFIAQTYNCSGNNTLESRLGNYLNNFNNDEDRGDMSVEELMEKLTAKFIVTENFEPVNQALAGGYPFALPDGTRVASLEGMARWKPANGYRKGGCGTYKMQNDYTFPGYVYHRKAIQIMNPAQN